MYHRHHAVVAEATVCGVPKTVLDFVSGGLTRALLDLAKAEHVLPHHMMHKACLIDATSRRSHGAHETP